MEESADLQHAKRVNLSFLFLDTCKPATSALWNSNDSA
jgi:hypothetical protein